MPSIPKPVRRVLITLPVLWVVVSVVFLLIHLVPGDPIAQMLGEGATAADTSTLRHSLGLDLPLHTQYLHYWRGVLHGDLGQSLRLTIPSPTWCSSATPTRSRSPWPRS